MITGIPGSGKTTLAQHIADTSGAVRCSYDDMPGANTRRETDGSVKRAWIERMRSALENGNSVICDTLNLTVRERKEILDEMSGIDCTKVLIVMMTPVEECIRRNNVRDAWLPEFIIRQAACMFEPPTPEEGWDMVTTDAEQGVWN